MERLFSAPAYTPHTHSQVGHPPLQRNSILVVDDSASVRAFATKALESSGFRVRTAEDFWIAAIISEFRPDLILMDVNIGHQSGVAATKALKRRKNGNGTKVVLLSDSSPETLAGLVVESHADGYIVKTPDPEEFVHQVRRYLPNEP